MSWLPVLSAVVLIHAGTALPARADAVPRQQTKTVMVASPVKGIVTKVFVKPGDMVQAGDILMQLDDKLAKNAVQAAEVQAEIAKQEYQKARADELEAEIDYVVTKKLGPVALDSEFVFTFLKSKWEKLIVEAKLRFHKIELAKAELGKAQFLMSEYQIKAPAGGAVVAIHQQMGEGVKELDTVIEIMVKNAAARQKKKTAKLASPVKGIIMNVLVEQGQKVKAGDVLVQLHDALAKKEVAIAEAQIKIAQEEYQSALATAKEAEKQHAVELKLPAAATGPEQIAIKKLIWDRAKAEANVRFQQIQLAKIALEKAKILLDQHQIKAPVDGTVAAIHRLAGEGVKELDTVIEIMVEEKKK
jgi:multidrug resistance efflux pump